MPWLADLLRFLYSGVEDEGQARALLTVAEAETASPDSSADSDLDDEALDLETQRAFLDFEVKFPFRSDGIHDFEVQNPAMAAGRAKVEDQLYFLNEQFKKVDEPYPIDNRKKEPGNNLSKESEDRRNKDPEYNINKGSEDNLSKDSEDNLRKEPADNLSKEPEVAEYELARRYVDDATEHGRPNRAWRAMLFPLPLLELRHWVWRFTNLNTFLEQEQEQLVPAGSGPRAAEVAHHDILYELLHGHRECENSAYHAYALLQLPVDSETFKMLLPTCKGAELHETSFRFDIWKKRGRPSRMNICTQLGSYRCLRRRLCLSFDSSGLWLGNDPTGRQVLNTPNPVSLETLFRKGRMREETPEIRLKKSRLAFQLASSLHRLYPGPWIQRNWEAHVVELDGENLCIRCELDRNWKTTNPVWREFNRAQNEDSNQACPHFFLCFAQLLVDISEGELGARPAGPTEDWVQYLMRKAQEIQRDGLLQWYGAAILGCLDYSLDCNIQQHTITDPRDRAQFVISDKIVANLRKNLDIWEAECRKYSQPEVGAVGVLRQPPAAAPTSFFTLFSDGDEKYEEGLPDDHCTNEFFNLMDVFTHKFILPLAKPPDYRPIRIAVLDTGIHIDGEDTLLSIFSDTDRGKVLIGDSRNYTGEETDVDDTHGHGTQVVRLLARLAPRAEIVMLKISNGRTLESTKLGRLIDALKYAGQSADIINLSFGLDQAAKQLIQPVIESLVTEGKLILAAASNSGGNGKRAYPAKESGVFAIHATKGNGASPENMNPPPDDTQDNFATLGYRIPSRWDGKDVHISGTSFATPVAAAIAANALEFVQCAEVHNRSNNSRYFHGWGGMRHLFSRMASKSGNYEYVRPWMDNMFDKDADIEGMYKELKEMSVRHR